MTLSVVIPLYNKAAYIKRTLDSVLAQSHGDFELIVVDDGSSDGSGSVVEEVADPRLRLIRKTNGGVSEARNRGVSEAAGEWIAFLDADDEWCPDFLKTGLAYIRAHPEPDTVFTNILSAADLSPWLSSVPAVASTVDDYFGFCVGNRGRGMTSSSVLVRKAALTRAGGFPAGVHLSEDSDTWIRLSLAGPIAFIPSVLAIYHNERTAPFRSGRLPVFPQGIRTLRRKREEGLIPEATRGSSLMLETLYLLHYADELIAAGARPDALRLLARECPACMRHLFLFSKTVGRLVRSTLASGAVARALPGTPQRQDG